ncbi:MAG: hypothetical protein ABSD67_11670 [Terracidiphilus sp.]
MSSGFQHVPFRLIKQLSAYSALFEAVPEASASNEQDESRELRTLESVCLSTIALLAPQTAETPPNGSVQLLPAYLEQINAGLTSNVSLALPTGGVQSQIGLESQKALSSRLLKDYCGDCTRKCSLPVCDGTDPIRDAQTVAVRGDCVAHLRSLFEQVKLIATEHYSEHAIDPGTLSKVEIQFGTRFVNDKPTTLGPNLPISAVTFRNKNSLNADVMLRFYVDDQDLLVLNRSSFLGLPYILMHEFICHAFDGVAVGGNRSARDERDTFAEGWMDWTAFQIVSHAFFGIAPRKLPRIALKGQYAACKEVFEARNAPSQRPTYSFYRLGSEVASDFLGFLRQLRPEKEAFATFLQISLKLTAWRDDATKMHKFVTNLRRLLPRPDDQAESPLTIDGLRTLKPIAENFINKGDILEFRESILRI